MNAPQSSTLTVSCIQTNSAPRLEENLIAVEKQLHAVKAKGAQLAVLPENVLCMARRLPDKLAQAFPEAGHPGVARLAALSRELGLWLVGGSVSIRQPDGKMANRSLLFTPEGGIAARYDKIHLYDADPKPGETYRESAEIAPGEKAVLAETPWGGLGLTICYDVRFPHLYRGLAQRGAVMLTVPAAFTETTGKVHWHTLLRARAIENGCFVFAAAQTGEHEGGRRTYGHSLIIAPWGEVLADAGTETGDITVTIDLAKVAEARRAIPSLQHDRPFAF